MSEITLQDIKKAYFTKANVIKTKLCYSDREVYIRQIKFKDKKDFLKILEQEDDNLLDPFVDSLIERYVADENSNPIKSTSLVDEERHQLLMYIRKAATLHESVDIDHVCPKCKVLNTQIKFPLENIKVINFKKPDGFDDVIVSKSGDVKFQISHLTRGDIVEIEKYIKDKGITTKIEKEFVFLASTVKELYITTDDISRKYIPNISDRVEFVENLVFDDFDKIKSYFSKADNFGVQLQFNFKCTDCDYSNETEEAKIVNFFIK
jgi:hypothetical protein